MYSGKTLVSAVEQSHGHLFVDSDAPGRASSYGTLTSSSPSTRQDWSGSRTRNGGWYSKAVKMLEPRLCFWYRNQIPAETPTTVITLRMTRMDSTGLGAEQSKQPCQGHKLTTLCARGRVLTCTYFASLSLPLKDKYSTVRLAKTTQTRSNAVSSTQSCLKKVRWPARSNKRARRTLLGLTDHSVLHFVQTADLLPLPSVAVQNPARVHECGVWRGVVLPVGELHRTVVGPSHGVI